MNSGLAGLLAALTVITAVPPPAQVALPTPVSSPSRVTNAPVLYVHGFILNVCPGGDVSNTFSSAKTVLQNMGHTGPSDDIAYYACDTNGSNIQTSGDPNAYFASGAYALDNTPTSRGGNTNNTDIRHISYQLAWYIYDTYTSKGQPVELVAHSMGGLISSWMMYQVQIKNPLFPPSLMVQDLVTISTPYAGVNDGYNNITWCPSTTQCSQMLPGSAFLTELQSNGLTPAVTGSTDWTAIGGSPCDTVNNPAGTTLAAGDVHKMWYYAKTPTAPVCYNHTSYLTDISTAQDMPIQYRNPGDANYLKATGFHSLTAAAQAVLYSNY